MFDKVAKIISYLAYIFAVLLSHIEDTIFATLNVIFR